MSPSSTPALTPELLSDLKARHIAFLEARLVSEAAERDFAANMETMRDALLSLKLGEIAPPDVVKGALLRIVTSETVDLALRPLVEEIGDAMLAELRADGRTVNECITPPTRKKIDQLLGRPGLVPERFLREMAEQEAVDELMRDVLYDALKEFSEKVNPFFAEWGLPALLKKLSPFGFGVGKGLDSLRADFDRRLEPEIRKFLQGFSKKSLRRMVEYVIAHGDEARFVAVRKHMAAWLLEQRLSELSRSADAEALALSREIALDVAAAELANENERGRLFGLLEQAIDKRKDRTLREVLDELGIRALPDPSALAALLWPLVRAALTTDVARAYFCRVVSEFYDAEAAMLPTERA